jgi:thioredoxin 2
MAIQATIKCPNCGRRNRLRPAAEGVPRCAVCGALLPWIVDADSDSFDAEIVASVPVLIDFWAPWCGPCRMVSPVVERFAAAESGRIKVVKVNIDAAPEIAARYDVQGIPLLVLVRDGQEVDRLVGAAPEGHLRGWLEPHLPARESAASS